MPFGDINPLDLALCAVLLLSAVTGLLRGFFRELISIAAWVGGAWAAARFGDWLAPQVALLPGNERLHLWIARSLILMLALFAGALLARLVASFLRGSGLGGADRVSGMIFGLGRALVLGGLAIIVARSTGIDEEPWWRGSKLIPYVVPVAEALREVADQGLKRSPSLSLGPFTDFPRQGR